MDALWLIAALAATGAFAGLIAGLFGIGGGVIMVPAMYFVFQALGYGEERGMHVAVATSLAVIIATSLRSVHAHAKRGAVDFHVVKTWSPWIVLGALIGTVIAHRLTSPVLSGVFGAVLILVSAQFFFGRPGFKLAEDMPGGLMRAGLGGLIGALSSIIGIGGGVFGVTLMTLCGKTIHRAVATAAGFGVAIGAPGALGHVVNGWGQADVPYSLGYVNIPGFLLLAACSFFVTPLGAKLAHALPAQTLKRAFAVVLAIIGAILLREALA